MTSRPDAQQPSSARIYDYFLGGRDNFEVDREAAEAFLAAIPNARSSARATRGFVLRSARYMAEQGITQFLDIGCGLPTKPNVHEVVRQIHPDARVAYVDNDPIVISRGRAMRHQPGDREGIITVAGDLRDPGSIVKNAQVAELLDFSQPIGVLTVAVWHFIPEDDATTYLVQLRDALAPGSMLALTHACTENLTPEQVRAGEALYKQTTNPVRARSREQIEALLEGFQTVEPGLVPLHEWRPRTGDPYPEQSPEALAGVGIRI